MNKPYLKALTSGVAALLFMSGITNQALAAATAKPVITSPSTKSCVVGTVCTYTITATNSPTSYGATGLQSWQSISSNVITGTPTTAGTFSVTVSATNAGGTGSLVVAFTVTLPPARVVVAPSGGNYTTISAAMAAINPTATNPVLIEVWPGVYAETESITLKSYVNIKGAGRDVTTVAGNPATGSVFQANRVTNVAISGLTISPGNSNISGILFSDTAMGEILDNSISGGQHGISVVNSVGWSTPPLSVRIAGNKMFGISSMGIVINSTSAVITDNTISTNAISPQWAMGLKLDYAGNTVVSGNVISSTTGVGIGITFNATPAISNNTITGNSMGGVFYYCKTSGGSLTNNIITNNGGLGVTIDEQCTPDAGTLVTPNISFNVADSIGGSPRGVGSYNVNSNGDPILVP